ncbi:MULTISPECIES: DUF7064 domain-containing protein [Pseudonocardia]|jgi:uncharacterized protein YndB with AHSA1/START domain|uniref:DUF7064 domain-containing protein n=2 Tax=Pseudonocardia TaxID=1847 RepID=A0A1Y2MPB3_PSEAH|nr:MULTISPECIES: hypothetical protein [Pseudonocardia]OSY37084.1 hypothetical protein BG845_04967 [Pseudonocardia autotrophica]TDN72056.1 hypothetical protein C8E95_1098 [Pseudonocardia autotrophica]BBG02754.1 hypothetical protein Pdca_39630 [Pseudonocardia autotrophica]GEC25913.1 hypothetical protein PSA01_29420 [Pseudonocardia saturnea]
MTLADTHVPDPGFGPRDDLRHWPAEAGGRMRDSLFYEMIMPDERLGLQVYLYLTAHGRAGFNVSVWSPDTEPLALDLDGGSVPEDMDLDDFRLKGLSIRQPELRRTAEVTYESEKVRLEYRFDAVQDAFSYRSNPDGLPEWFAQNRLEQTGRVSGFLEVGGRRVEWDRRMGHRDHSWGNRDWGIPHHWKWFVAYTDSGNAINGWIWIAGGEWGFAGSVLKNGVTVPVSHIEHKATYHDDMSQKRLEATLVDTAGGRTEVTFDRFALIRLPTNDKMATEIWESACDATIDGEAAAGQWETHWSRDYLNHLVASRNR